VDVTRPTLDDVFLNLTGRSLRESSAGEPGSPVPLVEPVETTKKEVLA
jgi:ABC-2 type transport system ATP-binding protein